MIISFLIVFLSLLLIALVYHRLALRFNIVDRPNHRSSHIHTTVRGGGILFPVAMIFWWMAFDFPNTWMILGVVWISAVSLLDDIYTLGSSLRFGVQILALSMAFYDLDLYSQVSWVALPFIYFIALGIINSVNFMDGINGITGLYGLVFLGTILAVNEYTAIFDEYLVRYELLAICVFLIFNLRRKALMFAGDIGSISLAYLMIYLMLQWYLDSGSWTVILLIIVYGVETGTTMMGRIKRKEKVLEPHRSHLYQLLVNQGGKAHVNVALGYALLQLGINFFCFIYPQRVPGSAIGFAVLFGLGILYLIIKYFVKRKYAID